MSTYSTQFFAGALAAGSSLVYTVPALEVVVLRDIIFWNNSAAAGPANAGIYSSTGQLLAVVMEDPSLAVFSTFEWQGRTVMTAGQQLHLGTANAGITCVVSGYLLGAS